MPSAMCQNGRKTTVQMGEADGTTGELYYLAFAVIIPTIIQIGPLSSFV